MLTVFFAYSHEDEDLRNKLEIHLSTLKRQDMIETWHDRRIVAGKELDSEIDANLENSDIVLLLVSPYFIASDYCYNIEMQHAMKRHHNGEARVIPVILHPCDWQHTPLGKLRATPPDGKPVSKFPNQHDAFLAITMDIRRAVEEIAGFPPIEDTLVESAQQDALTKQHVFRDKPRSSNLRVRREFTDIERSRYLSETFDYLVNFFENSLAELENRSDGIETESRRVDTNRFTAAIYRSGNLISQGQIWMAVDSHSSGEICYTSSRSLDDNSWNESLIVDDDGYVFGLRTLGTYGSGVDSKSLLTEEGGAELFWNILISPLQ